MPKIHPVNGGPLPANPNRLLATAALFVALLMTTAADWPTYLHDSGRTSAGDERILSPANAGRLAPLWLFRANGAIAASAAVVNNVVYVGSWDGFEYALDAVTGALKWKTYLGVTSGGPDCNPLQAGVTSSATVQDGVVYVGGGDSYWYALDATTGAVRWKVFTGDNSAKGGYYNWSSPLIYNGYAYIGVASFGDCPLVRGQLLRVSLRTHRVVRIFNVVPRAVIGGTIWGSPSVDTATNTIYVATASGSGTFIPSPYTQALVALDARTLTVRDAWQVPTPPINDNVDFGSTPVLFHDAKGTSMVAVVNKNGVVYAFKRARLRGGPVWKRPIAIDAVNPRNGGVDPQNGDGSVAPPAFAQGRLYLAGGITTITGVRAHGAVRALDPATGAYLWQHGTPGAVLGAPAYTNGLIVDGGSTTMEVLNAATGARLYQYHTDAMLYGAPSVSNGRIFVGSVDGRVYAFGLTAASPSPTPQATSSPSPTPAAGSISLASLYNNVGISDDRAPGSANFDGVTYSYSRQALQAGGITPGQPMTSTGVTFQWPNVAPGTPDNVVAQGQTLAVTATTTASAVGTKLAFLGASTYGPAKGTGIITYSDGSTQRFTLSFSDWTLDNATVRPVSGTSIVATMPYRNTTLPNRNSGYEGQEAGQVLLFSTAVALQPGKTVASLTLPAASGKPQLHIFAITAS